MPRLWVGPGGEAVDLDEADRSHCRYVVENLEDFGVGALLRPQLHEEGMSGEPIDFDVVIAAAEARGWVRVSRDGRRGVAISAASPRHAARGLRHLIESGVTPRAAMVEIETMDALCVSRRCWHLDGDAVDALARTGRLPRLRCDDGPK